MNAPKAALLQAIDLALAGECDAAHEAVQQYEEDATGTGSTTNYTRLFVCSDHYKLPGQ